jgi:hypothetical protein
MPTDAPDGLINQHVVTSVKARKTTKKAADKPADEEAAAPSDKAK